MFLTDFKRKLREITSMHFHWWMLIVAGLSVMYLPVYNNFFMDEWQRHNDSYSWLVAVIAFYLFFQNRHHFSDSKHYQRTTAETLLAVMFYVIGLLSYILGTSQSIQTLALVSQIFIFLGLIIFYKGFHLARKCWFALFFLIFVIPVPAYLLDPVTLPMKIMVSIATEWILQHSGYLVGRDGVILQVEQYQLLVADACAGMKTLLSLEAMGLLYLHVVKHDSLERNLLLGLLIIPISMLANISRVTILALITYHLGDSAGRGFMHFYAGIVLFMIALGLIMLIDHLIQRRIESRHVN